MAKNWIERPSAYIYKSLVTTLFPESRFYYRRGESLLSSLPKLGMTMNEREATLIPDFIKVYARTLLRSGHGWVLFHSHEFGCGDTFCFNTNVPTHDISLEQFKWRFYESLSNHFLLEKSKLGNLNYFGLIQETASNRPEIELIFELEYHSDLLLKHQRNSSYVLISESDLESNLPYLNPGSFQIAEGLLKEQTALPIILAKPDEPPIFRAKYLQSLYQAQ